MPASLLNYNNHWPDGVDWLLTAGYIALICGIFIAGYGCMVLDIRAYLRSLRRALVVVAQNKVDLPDWVLRGTPRCLRALDLHLPCTSEDVLNAYRQKVKILHPDRGGERREFLQLQRHFEQAMALVERT